MAENFPDALLEGRILAKSGDNVAKLYQVLWWSADVVEYAERWANSESITRRYSPGWGIIAHSALQPD